MTIKDPTISLRASFNAALAILEPQLRGLIDVSSLAISTELRQEITTEAGRRERRKALILAVLAAFDAVAKALHDLDEDGYPDFPAHKIAKRLVDEINADHADIHNATSLFEPADPATKVEVNLGDPADKP